MTVEEASLVGTRRALHAIAEYVLAGPQYAAHQSIRLRVTPGGFGTCLAPDIRVEGAELVTPEVRVPLGATCAALAEAAGVQVRDLRDVYPAGPELSPDETVLVDPVAAATILDAFAQGDAAMRGFAPTEVLVLWPEHFDLGITVDEVNYGVSPGDTHSSVPYAYVGPWTPRAGSFWNAPFGAARPMADVFGVGALVQFFREGAERAVEDPVEGS